MPAASSSAPGKAILLGEHAVVYGQPALAVPVNQVKARAYISALPLKPSGTIQIDAPDIQLNTTLSNLDENHAFKVLFNVLQNELNIKVFPALSVKIKSEIPIASGLGSGAAVTIAILRGVSSFLGCPLENEKISALAFKVEKIYHGTPSGIDNTVITYEKPVYFKHGEEIKILSFPGTIQLLVADSGISSQTAEVVMDVRSQWQKDSKTYDAVFSKIGTISFSGKEAIEQGNIQKLGQLMNEDHSLLKVLHVSNPKLDQLVNAALQSGALGAKLSGAGRGGNMIALVTEESVSKVKKALLDAGAVRVIFSEIKSG